VPTIERICNWSNRKMNKKVLPGTEKVGRPNQVSVTGRLCQNVPLLQFSSPRTTMDADFNLIVVIDSWQDKHELLMHVVWRLDSLSPRIRGDGIN
jgi:hypothetical protein